MNMIILKKNLKKIFIPEIELKDFVEKCLVFEPTKRFNVYQLKKHPFLANNKSISNIETTINNSFYS